MYNIPYTSVQYCKVGNFCVRSSYENNYLNTYHLLFIVYSICSRNIMCSIFIAVVHSLQTY